MTDEIGFALFGLALGLILGFCIGQGEGYKRRVHEEDDALDALEDDMSTEMLARVTHERRKQRITPETEEEMARIMDCGSHKPCMPPREDK